MKKIEYKYIVALIYTCVLFIDRMDITLINVALPTLAKYFQVPVTSTEWISTAYLLALALVIIASGWAGERFGNKKIFIVANSLVLIGSALSAFSWSLSSLVFFRVVQGIGGGVLVPAGMSMTYREFSPKEYSKVASYTLMPTLVAPALAPTVGGLILQYSNWRWTFFMHIPMSILAITLSVLYLKEREIKKQARFDLIGFLLSSSALVLLLYVISRLGTKGSLDSLVIIGSLTAAGLFSLFVWFEKSCPYALIDLKLFKISLFVRSNVMQLFLQICYFGSLFLLALYLQIGLNLSPLLAGVVLCVQPLGTILMMPKTAKLFNIYGPKSLLFGGMFGIAILSYFIYFLGSLHFIAVIALLLFLRGACIGLVNVPVQAMAMLDINKEDTGRATAVLNAFRQVSITLGIALSSLCIKYGFHNHNVTGGLNLSSNQVQNYFQIAFLFITGCGFLGMFFAFFFHDAEIKNKIQKNM